MLDTTHGTNPPKNKLFSFVIDDTFGHKEFPLARIFICHFHPKKYRRTEMSKSIYGGRNGVDVDRVEDAVDMMVKAKDKKTYDRGLRYMYYTLDGFDEEGDLPKSKHSLLDCFIRN
ncbi:hypothetical protein PHMEG_0008587 [Phytophthora megakarya]|uniref:Uncharacterized protein n=1 Tax=Phytophthora megakarya TaxID=4795 RepID=A0A225WIE4_9STRA|nr:hypothetical protein PHMEG_0008587 [Phytophthora megakarya]